MRKNIFNFLLSVILLAGCNQKSGTKELETRDISVKAQAKNVVVKYGYGSVEEFAFQSGDSLKVTLKKDDADLKKLGFLVEIKGNKFKGVANLVLLEDNGKFYVPEGTPIRDEKTNEDYKCDSTFSYDSRQISFVFAMENLSKQRLSFIINNSSIDGLGDNLYTLYRRN